jgi:hypothetical protein
VKLSEERLLSWEALLALTQIDKVVDQIRVDKTWVKIPKGGRGGEIALLVPITVRVMRVREVMLPVADTVA